MSELAIIAVVLLVLSQLREDTLRAAEAQSTKISRIISEETDRSLQGVDLLISGLAQQLVATAHVSSARAFAAQRNDYQTFLMLKDKAGILPQLDALSLIGLNGDLINFSRYFPIPKINVADRDYFIALRMNPSLKSFISIPVRNRANGAWTVYLARRFESPDHHLIGLLLGSINLSYFEKSFANAAIEPGDRVSLLRNDGILLARYPPAPQELGRIISIPEFPDGSGNSITIRKIGVIDHVPEMISRERLDDYPVTVNIVKTEESILAPWRYQATIIGGCGLLAELSILLFTLLLWREFSTHEKLSRAEIEIVRAQKLQAAAEETSATKSQFLANMSHELRTPLNAVIGFSEFVSSEVLGPIGSPKYKEYLADIRGAGIYLLAIVSDILEFSRAEARQITISPSRVNVHTVIEETCRMLRPQADQARITLVVTVVAGLPAIVTDGTRLKQVLVNLLSNAIKFSVAGSEVELSAHISATSLVIRIRDAGIGIAPSDIPKAMAPFGQVESEISRRYHGTGLGLPLAKIIVELLGGNLQLDSLLGHGTTVTVTLPWHDDDNGLVHDRDKTDQTGKALKNG